ncbi:DUF397 domain-containing protein [Kibdelosporangium persicum]|uniref:DUF397 domain-containing protein n=1 Tax=Kibdelosporangium persicum TaxID=2698649 RepID=UPI0015662E5D|nr:DUF397 domain-containing protein [Kibdelosporangium persicum]
MTSDTKWRRSSRSWGGDCVEVCHVESRIRIRDSKDPRQILDIPWSRASEFTDYLKSIPPTPEAAAEREFGPRHI